MDRLEVEDQIIVALRRIIRAIELRSRQLVERVGLTGPQLVTLQQIVRWREATPSALARAIHVSQSTLTGILDRLERRGLIVRAPCGQDRRSVTVSATAAGEGVLAQSPSLLQEHFRAQLSALQEWEQTLTLATLQRIAAMMDAENLDASAVLATGPVDAGHGDHLGGAAPETDARASTDFPGAHAASPAQRPMRRSMNTKEKAT